MARSAPVSLRASLTIRLALALFVVAIIGTVFAYLLGARFGNAAYDRAQADDVVTLGEQITVDHDQVRVNLPAAALTWLLADEGEMVRYRVTDLRRGEAVATNGDLGPTPSGLYAGEPPVFRDTDAGGRAMRVASMRREVGSSRIPVLIEIGETMGKRKLMTDTILVGTLLFMTTISLLAIGLVWFGIGWALQPLKLVEAEAEARSGTNLAPLEPQQVPQEIRGLIVAINRMMERVSSVMQSQSHFIANAAHQLRTPLSGVRLQAQLGLKSQDPQVLRARLSDVEGSAIRASDLVEKLLVLAKAESGRMAFDAQPVDLGAVARQVLERHLRLADERQVDLGLSLGESALYIDGSAFLFSELLGNLVDNAIRHGHSGGRVTIELEDDGADAVVAVVDDGPGFADADLEQLFTRFYRRDSTSSNTGSGLGLAIVHEIARHFESNVTLDSTPGQGSRFELRLRKSAGGPGGSVPDAIGKAAPSSVHSGA